MLLVIFLFSCSADRSPVEERILLDKEKPLFDGDIICRLGNGFFSNMFREHASAEKKYSHIGIIELDRDSIFVIHVEASEMTGVGFVKRESLAVFLDGIDVWGVYRIAANDSIHRQIVENAKVFFSRSTPFDLDFNSTDDSEVYCSELVALAINRAMVDSLRIRPSKTIRDKRLYTLDDIYKSRGVEQIY